MAKPLPCSSVPDHPVFISKIDLEKTILRALNSFDKPANSWFEIFPCSFPLIFTCTRILSVYEFSLVLLFILVWWICTNSHSQLAGRRVRWRCFLGLDVLSSEKNCRGGDICKEFDALKTIYQESHVGVLNLEVVGVPRTSLTGWDQTPLRLVTPINGSNVVIWTGHMDQQLEPSTKKERKEKQGKRPNAAFQEVCGLVRSQNCGW